MIPRTPKERAEDLKAVGAVVRKLPSFKRGEFIVTCPTCGKQATDWGGIKFWPQDKLAEQVKTGHAHDRILLEDHVYNARSAWAHHHSGDTAWRQIRAHVVACTDDELDDSRRRDAIGAVHALRRGVARAPEMTRKVLYELVALVDDIATDQRQRNAAAGDDLVSAERLLRTAAAVLVDPPHLPDATREARARISDEEKQRMRHSNEAMRKAFFGK